MRCVVAVRMAQNVVTVRIAVTAVFVSIAVVAMMKTHVVIVIVVDQTIVCASVKNVACVLMIIVVKVIQNVKPSGIVVVICSSGPVVLGMAD